MVDVVLDDDDDDKAKILNNATAPSCDKSCLCARVNIPGYIDKGSARDCLVSVRLATRSGCPTEGDNKGTTVKTPHHFDGDNGRFIGRAYAFVGAYTHVIMPAYDVGPSAVPMYTYHESSHSEHSSELLWNCIMS
jgi:hypothetical protein